MASETILRPARIEDAHALAGLSAELGYPVSAEVLGRRLARLMSSPVDVVLVAERGAAGVVGWIHGLLCQLVEADLRVEIGGLIVAQGARCAGVGTALVRAVESWALARGAVEVSVRCQVHRLEAHRFYEHLGFRHAKTQHAFRRALAGVSPPANAGR